MRIQEVINALEELAPLSYAEDFDNVGLLTGSAETEVSGIIVSLDVLEEVVDEAISKNCNLIVCFHPIIFSGLKKLSGSGYVERCVVKAIKNDIAIFAVHTALDNSFRGVNNMICEKLKLQNRKILIPKQGIIHKLQTYIPKENAEEVREALFRAGAGNIGNYEDCSFNITGTGTFKGNDDSNPVKGQRGKLHFEDEVQVSVIFPAHLKLKVLKTLFREHPYEEVAYEVTRLENKHQHLGMGMTGELEKEMEEESFLKMLKEVFDCGCIRHSNLRGKPVKKVAVLGGSGSFAIENAKKAGADIFITADLKYHDFFKGTENMMLADIGHYESEQYTKNLLHSYLTEKFANFAIVLSNTNTNPIKYF